jgi:cytochrome c oxidase cbb3-type subunit 3/ubiquinol-cytochrome c reductase cytochrome c subunit
LSTIAIAAACSSNEPPPPSPPTIVHDAAPNPQIDIGAGLYAKYCATCHGAKGEGYIADNAPSLNNPTFLATATDPFLRIAIAQGRPGTAMAAYDKRKGGPLDNRQIAAVIAYLRGGKPAPPAPPAPSKTGDAKRGEPVYVAKCQECHGTRTERSTAVHLANETFLLSASDGFMRHAIVHGRPGTKMQSFGGVIDDGQIDDVVAYVRSWGLPTGHAHHGHDHPPPPGEPTGPLPDEPKQIVINPKGKPPAFDPRDGKFVSVDQVKAALDQKRRLVIVDARPKSDWARQRIPGSIPVPYYELGGLDKIPKDTWVVAYCACPHHLSGIIVDELRKRGHAMSAVLDEGINVWEQKGYPITKSPGAKPPPKQKIKPGSEPAMQ